MKNNTPLVSFIIPTYNRPYFLKDCVNSVLNQTVKDFEIVIIDDCSCGIPDSLIQDMRSKDNISYVINSSNLGFYGSLNRGIENSKGKYLCFLADDDMLLENHLEKALEILEKDENIALFSCDCLQIDEKGNRTGKMSYLEAYSIREGFELVSGKKDFRYMLLRGGISFGAAVLRRKAIQEIGLLDSSYRIAGDVDFWLRISLSRYDIFFLKEPLFLVRNHEGCITRKKIIEFYFERIKILKNLLNNKFKIGKIDLIFIRKKMALELIYLSITYLKNKNFRLAFKYFLKANIASKSVVVNYAAKSMYRKNIKNEKVI